MKIVLCCVCFFLFGCGSTISLSPALKAGLVPTADQNGTPLTTVLPVNFDPKKTYKWVIYDHGSDQLGHAIAENDPQLQSITSALSSAGYLVASSNYRTEDCWGNQTCVDDIRALYEAYTSSLNLDPRPFIIGASMGGMVTLNAVLHGDFTPRAMVGIYPACNLQDMYDLGPFVGAIQADYEFTGASQLAHATNKYDPLHSENLAQLTKFPILFWASYGDKTVKREMNADMLATSVNALGGSVTINTSTGDHGDWSNYQPNAVVEFFNGVPSSI